MTSRKLLQEKTRWAKIRESEDGYRLSCSDPFCSLSCANLRNGRMSTTSVHGKDRHSYVMTKHDMVFAAVEFLDSLSDKELQIFCSWFNKISEEKMLTSDQKLQKPKDI